MTSIGSNIASSSGVSSSEGPLVPTWISLTLEEHLQNFKRMIYKGGKDWYGEYLSDKFLKSVVEVVEALRMDPCEDIDHLLIRCPTFQYYKLLGSTSLHWAILMDDKVMVHHILSSRKVNINATTIWGGSALSYAIVCRNLKIVEDLLEHKADVFTGQALRNMVHEKDSMFGIFKRILTNNVNACDEAKKTALHHAVEEGYIDVVAYLLNEKADVNLEDYDGYTPLRYAVERGSLDVVKLLLQQNADVNVLGRISKGHLLHLAHLAVKDGATSIVSLLVDYDVVVDNDGRTPLHYAIEEGSFDAVKLHLQQNTNVNAVLHSSKESPLHLAAKIGATNIVSLLVDHNGVVDALDNKGWTPLLYSLRYRRFNTFNALIAAGANVNIKNENGNNALHLAIESYSKNNNMMDIVKHLRECDADANAKNSQGYSPFFAAVVLGHTEVVKELLQSKQKIKLMEECNGQTAIQIAFDNDHEHIKRALLECDDVSRYVETLYRDRQVYVDAANAILVGAALIASVTFASWLQPPLGYTTSYLDLAPSSSNINYVDVQHNPSLRAFWIFNTLSFYFAIGTVVFGARSVLPRRKMFIKVIVVKLHQNLLVTSILLACSVLCVIVAFGIAGCIVLTPILKFQWYMIVPTVFGGLVCLVSLAFLFKSTVEDNLGKKKKTYNLF